MASNYCVYLTNWPFINNRGQLAMCCKNDRVDINPPFGNIRNTPLKELWHSIYIEHQRHKMACGSMPEGCNICYDYERDVDIMSFRMRSLYGVHHFADGFDWENPRMKEPYQDKQIRALDLRIGSICNCACIMCHPSDSSKWHGNYERYDREVNQPCNLKHPGHVETIKQLYRPSLLNWAEHESSWKNIFNSIDRNLKKVYMAGGEPFYLKNFPEYVRELVGYAPDVTIDINTNGTHLLNEQHISQLRNHLRISISVDGYELMDEFHRVGTVWQKKVDVMDQCYKYLNIRTMDITITSLSVRGLPNLIKFITERYPDTAIMLRPVVNKPGLAIQDIPRSLRQSTIDFFNQIPAAKKQGDNCLFVNYSQFEHDLKMPDSIKKNNNRQILQHTIKYTESISNIKYHDIDSELNEWIFKL